MRKVLSKILHIIGILIGCVSFIFVFLAVAGPDIGIQLSYPIHPFLLLLLLILTGVISIILSHCINAKK